MKRAALALLLMALPSAAQEIEQVTVYGGSLNGFWQIESPGWLQMSMFGNVTWGPLRQVWCRIDHRAGGYATHCFRGDAAVGGTLEQDGRHFHLAGGSMLARQVFDGEVTSPTAFEGHHAIK